MPSIILKLERWLKSSQKKLKTTHIHRLLSQEAALVSWKPLTTELLIKAVKLLAVHRIAYGTTP